MHNMHIPVHYIWFIRLPSLGRAYWKWKKFSQSVRQRYKTIIRMVRTFHKVITKVKTVGSKLYWIIVLLLSYNFNLSVPKPSEGRRNLKMTVVKVKCLKIFLSFSFDIWSGKWRKTEIVSNRTIILRWNS